MLVQHRQALNAQIAQLQEHKIKLDEISVFLNLVSSVHQPGTGTALFKASHASTL